MHACNGFLCNRVTGRKLSCEARLTQFAVWVCETMRPARIRQWVCLIALATAKNTVRQQFKLTSGLIPICPERYIVRSTTTAWLHEVWKTKQYRKKTEQEHLATTAATFLISPNTAVGNELIKWLVKKGVCSQVTPISHADTRDSALKWYPCCHVPAYTITTYNARLHLLVLALCSFPFSAWI